MKKKNKISRFCIQGCSEIWCSGFLAGAHNCGKHFHRGGLGVLILRVSDNTSCTNLLWDASSDPILWTPNSAEAGLEYQPLLFWVRRGMNPTQVHPQVPGIS